MKKIAVEEHFLTQGFVEYLVSKKEGARWEVIEPGKIERVYWSSSFSMPMNPELKKALLDLSNMRLRLMDEAGIDMQVLSLSAPGLEALDPSEGTTLAEQINNELAGVIKRNPNRFAGLAAIAPQNPDAAAKELRRAVRDLGFKGAIINSHINGEYLDDQKFWVILETAEKLGVPIYLHPRQPSPDMIKPYLTYPALASAMWGFGAETGLHAMRLICAGIFDRYPNLKIILGHLGEAIPYWLWRIDNFWLVVKRGMRTADPSGTKCQKEPSQYFKNNFYVSISGMFWQPAMLCAQMAVGVDRILFAVDYPYELNNEAVNFMESLPLSNDDKEKIYHLNAERLLGL